MGRVGAYTCTDNFWSKLRVDSKFTLKDIADFLRVSVPTVCKYFTGEVLPSDETITLLCRLFDVDEVRGKSEFLEAHKKWDVNHNRKVLARADVEQPNKTEAKKEVKTEEKTELEKVADVYDNSNVFEMVYGKLSYDEFNKFFDAVAGKDGDPLELIYGKVSFEEYSKIADIIRR